MDLLQKAGLNKEGNKWPGNTVEFNDDIGKAALGTPHGKAISWFLAQHRTLFGLNEVKSVILFKPLDKFFTVWKIGPIEAEEKPPDAPQKSLSRRWNLASRSLSDADWDKVVSRGKELTRLMQMTVDEMDKASPTKQADMMNPDLLGTWGYTNSKENNIQQAVWNNLDDVLDGKDFYGDLSDYVCYKAEHVNDWKVNEKEGIVCI